MQEQFYVAHIERSDSGYGVYFPDLPGCVSAGGSMRATLQGAREALALHISGLVEDGDPIPAPSEESALKRDPTIVAVSLVPVMLPGKKKRVNVTIDEGLLAAIDAVSSNRSNFLERAARHELLSR